MVGPRLCGMVTEQLEDKMRSSGSCAPRMGNVLCVLSASAKKVCKSALGGRACCASLLTASAGTGLWSHTASVLGSQRGRCWSLSNTEVSLPGLTG